MVILNYNYNSKHIRYESRIFMKLLLLLTSLVHGLSLEVMRSVIQLSEGHMGMYSAGCPDWPQL